MGITYSEYITVCKENFPDKDIAIDTCFCFCGIRLPPVDKTITSVKLTIDDLRIWTIGKPRCIALENVIPVLNRYPNATRVEVTVYETERITKENVKELLSKSGKQIVIH